MIVHAAPRDSQGQSLLEKLIRCANLATCLPSEIQAASADQITIAQNTLTEITESYSMKQFLNATWKIGSRDESDTNSSET